MEILNENDLLRLDEGDFLVSVSFHDKTVAVLEVEHNNKLNTILSLKGWQLIFYKQFFLDSQSDKIIFFRNPPKVMASLYLSSTPLANRCGLPPR